MTDQRLLFDSPAATLLTGTQITDLTLAEIEMARHRIWACYFITSLGVNSDPVQVVRQIAQALIRAARRGVDVRLLIDDFEAEDGYRINHVAARYLAEKGVAVRAFQSDRHQSTHSKYILVDDDIQIVGSGNLSHGGLAANLEMAMRVQSDDVLRWLGDRFLSAWSAAAPADGANL